MSIHEGACHCGAVRFRVEADFAETYACDCSFCRMRGAVMAAAPAACFTLLSGADAVREYRWNTRTARHFFCGTCGIYTHHRQRRDPGLISVNTACLEGFDAEALPRRRAQGAAASTVADGSGDAS